MAVGQLEFSRPVRVFPVVDKAGDASQSKELTFYRSKSYTCGNREVRLNIEESAVQVRSTKSSLLFPLWDCLHMHGPALTFNELPLPR